MTLPLTEIVVVEPVTVLGFASSETVPGANFGCFDPFAPWPLLPIAAGATAMHAARAPSTAAVMSLRIVFPS